MSDPFVAEIRMFAGNFAPTGWAQCNGQLLPISQNTALFSLLGTYYGGDGKSTFALPNLQGSSPMHAGQSTTGTQYFLGQQAGSEYVTLIQSEIPAHTHNMQVSNNDANTDPAIGSNPTNQLPAKGSYDEGGNTGVVAFYTSNAPNVQLNFQSTAIAGGSLPHNNMQPYLTVLFIIALQGVFPARP
jgi:microcystin-dependent protein